MGPFYIPIGGHQQPLSERVIYITIQKKGHELNHMVPSSYFSKPGNLQWDLGEAVKGCYKHIEFLYQHPKPHPLHPQERRHIQVECALRSTERGRRMRQMGTLVAWSFLKKGHWPVSSCIHPKIHPKHIQESVWWFKPAKWVTWMWEA